MSNLNFESRNTKLEGNTLDTYNSKTLFPVTIYSVILFLKTRGGGGINVAVKSWWIFFLFDQYDCMKQVDISSLILFYFVCVFGSFWFLSFFFICVCVCGFFSDWLYVYIKNKETNYKFFYLLHQLVTWLLTVVKICTTLLLKTFHCNLTFG